MTNSKEIKIIIKVNENNCIVSHNTLVTVDDEPIGCIQEISFNANVNELLCKLDVVFPNLKSDKIDQKSYRLSPNLISAVDHSVEKLKDILGVNISLKEIVDD